MPTSARVLSSVLSLALVSLSAGAETANTVPRLQLTNKLTLSGLSAGGYMANQFHIAFSDRVSGAGIIAAGPYACAQNSLQVALEHCFNKVSSAPDLAQANTLLQQQINAGSIAALLHLKDSRVFIFHGTADKTVQHNVTAALATQYRQLGANVQFVDDKPFGHNFPTIATGSNCATSEAPFLAACNYDAAGALLAHLLPELKAKAATASGTLFNIDQRAIGGDSASSIAKQGFVYVPSNCAQGQSCQLHISFHGCKQYAGAVGDAYAKGTGLNEWADTNNMVVLYPQVDKSAMAPFNPNGCWDWWGYTDSNYTNQQGPQLKAVMAMATALGFKD